MGKSTEATSLVTRMASEQDPREKTSVKPRYHWVGKLLAICDWRDLRPGVEQVIGRKP